MTVLSKYLGRTLAVALICAVLTPVAALAARQTYTAPKFPVPASARVQPLTGGAVVSPTGTAAPTVKTTVPQTGVTVPGATTPTVATTTPAPATNSVPKGSTRQVAPKATTGSSGLSTPAAIAAVIAALLALGCAVWAIARVQAYEPRWTLSLRHTFAEASFRASATWAEFGDWARLGR